LRVRRDGDESLDLCGRDGDEATNLAMPLVHYLELPI
jgi:hypothetical protein